MKNSVFIHTNHRQMVGALVSQYSLKRYSSDPDAFDVKLIDTNDHAFLSAREGQFYLRDGVQRQWLMEDLQSFTPLRFMPPELMGYEGRAVVIDPDVFAVGDINELLTRDMHGKALMCREGKGRKSFASSVMLMDCAKLTHWRTAENFDAMFESKLDYMDWISLRTEPRENIGPLEAQWNDFDHLDANTKLLHNTKRWNQPWKTGLPVDFTPTEGSGVFRALGWLRRARAGVFGRYALLGQYKRHWDQNQENFFFGLLRECLEKGVLTEAMLRDEMERNHVRHDAFEVLERTPRLAA